VLDDLIRTKKWPCLFTSSDTTGEKRRSFYRQRNLRYDRFRNFESKNEAYFDESVKLDNFTKQIGEMKPKLN
jgi:hypothetical protein